MISAGTSTSQSGMHFEGHYLMSSDYIPVFYRGVVAPRCDSQSIGAIGETIDDIRVSPEREEFLSRA